MFVHVPLEEFARRTGLRLNNQVPKVAEVRAIVSLREIRRVLHISSMSISYLEAVIRNIPLAHDERVFPYANARISLARIDPYDIRIAQTFIQRSKYQSLLEDFSGRLDGYCVTRGAAKCNAMVIFGEMVTGETAVAHYVPPLIERWNGDLCLLDGVHRNFLVKSVGTTIESVIITGASVPFPARGLGWGSVKLVDEKPPESERFFELRPEYFRNVKAVGIDG